MGQVRVDPPLNSTWGAVIVEYKENKHHFPYHAPTREIFNLDPAPVIRCKCLALILMTPLITIARSVYWLSLSIFMALSEVYHYLDGQDISNEAQQAIIDTAKDSVRAIWYGALLTGCALLGTLAPYWGRQHYGWLERDLNRHGDGPHRDKFYLAFCFQRLCILPEENPENSDLLKNKLTKYLTHIDAIREALFSGSFRKLATEFRLMRAAI